MDVQLVPLLLLAGAASGFLAGMFGVAGGIVLVPVLLVILQNNGVSSLVATHITFGTSLLAIAVSSVSASYEYARNKHVVWRAVWLIGGASVVGALIGTALASALLAKSLQQIFSAVVVLAALRLLSEQRKPKGDPEPNMSPPALLLTGLAVGVVSSLAGIGGGVLSIPILYSSLRFPLKKALGTSSTTIVITALAGSAGYAIQGWGNALLPPLTLGYVAYLHAVPVAVAWVPMAMLGAVLASRTPPPTLKKVFAVILLIVAIRMFVS
jgi:hypothetical protein